MEANAVRGASVTGGGETEGRRRRGPRAVFGSVVGFLFFSGAVVVLRSIPRAFHRTRAKARAPAGVYVRVR